MSQDSELRRLERLAVNIVKIPDREERHRAGMYLNQQLVQFDEQYNVLTQIDTPIKTEFMAVVHIMMDFIFHDALEDTDWAEVLPGAIEAGVDVTSLLRKDPTDGQ